MVGEQAVAAASTEEVLGVDVALVSMVVEDAEAEGREAARAAVAVVVLETQLKLSVLAD